MIDVHEWNWIVDTNKMTCKNEENQVTIAIKKDGTNLKGMLEGMPINLFSEIAGYTGGEKIIQEIVKTAEEEYFRVYLNR
jgi:hypothetical protein